jgi:cell division protein FtsW (lipid II flippase)
VSPLRGNRQILFYAVSLGIMVLVTLLVTRIQRYHLLTLFVMVAGLAILVLPLIFGQWNNGAKNWVSLPVLGSFQPSELVKISVLFALAYYFSAHRTFIQMLPALLFTIACLIVLMLQRDLGTALIYYLSTLVVFYIACGNIPLTLLGAGGGVGAAILGYRMFAHVKVRVAMWKNPWSDPTGGGYQIIQALLAISSGGLFGMGLGQGTPEKIPAYYNDFIFAVICEQFGQIFGVLLLLLYVIILARAVTLVNRSRRSLTMLLGYGTVAMLGIQTFMITGGVIKLIPLTGVTMPFLSYGGSSMLSCMAMIGILHGISGKQQVETKESVSGKGGNNH